MAQKPLFSAQLSAHDAMKCGWPIGVPKTFKPRSEDGLFPRQTSAPSSAIPDGGSPPAYAGMTVHPSLAVVGSYAASFLHGLHHGVASLEVCEMLS